MSDFKESQAQVVTPKIESVDESFNELEAVATNEADIPERKITPRVVLAIISLAFSYEALLFSFILPANVLLYINESIGPSNNYTWILVGNTLVNSVLQALSGRLSDIFGRRYIIVAANAFGVIGCLIAAR